MGEAMSQYANNIPTNDKVFTPMTGSDIPSVIADIEVESPYGEDDPARPVDDLIKAMPAQRVYLMKFLRAAADTPTMDDIKGIYNDWFEYSPTVFSAYDMCVLLEEAGAIERVTADGAPYDMSTAEPVMVTDEATGAVYYQANEPADLHWKLTDAGQTILDDDDPVGRAQACFDADEALQPLFKRLLTLCQAEEGAELEALNDALNYDDLAWEPRVYAPYFIDCMEKADAIEWTGTWKLTDTGTQVLALLEAVEDHYDPAEQAANKAAYLDTFADHDEPDDVVFEGELIDQNAIAAASDKA